jgi:hypothetical protein
MEGGSPLTLVEYHLENKNDDHSSTTTIYSFLNFEWAMVSDVDFESEEYRRTLGSARLDLLSLPCNVLHFYACIVVSYRLLK